MDQPITHWQEKSRAALSAINLEKLGWAYVAKARQSFDPGYYKLAEQTALCSESQNPGNLDALLLKGHVLHQLHRFKAAEKIAVMLVRQRGAWFDFALLGDAFMEQGKIAAAIGAYQSMMDLRPGPQAYSRAAHMRWLTGDVEGAVALMALTVDSGGNDHEAMAWATVQWAKYLLLAGKVTEAKAVLRKALQIQPGYPAALLVLGRCLLAQGQAGQAVPLLAKAVAANPLPFYLWTLAEALRASGQTQQASVIEDRLHRFGASEDQRSYALYLATTGRDLPKALYLARKELKVRQDVMTLDTLAWALLANGDHEQAYKIHQQAVALGTVDARLFFHAGEIAAAKGKHREAINWLKRATQLHYELLPIEIKQLNQSLASLQALAQPSVTAIAEPSNSL